MGLDDQGSVPDRVNDGIFFLFATAPGPALGPIQPAIQCVPEKLTPRGGGIKQPRREVDHSSPSSAEVKDAWSYTSIPPVRLYGAVLI
jgi:hypothetical protein